MSRGDSAGVSCRKAWLTLQGVSPASLTHPEEPTGGKRTGVNMKHVYIIQGKPKNVNIQYTEKSPVLTGITITIRVTKKMREYIAEMAKKDHGIKPIPDNVTAFILHDGFVFVQFVDGRIGKTPLTTVDNFRLLRYLFNANSNGVNVPKWLSPSNV